MIRKTEVIEIRVPVEYLDLHKHHTGNPPGFSGPKIMARLKSADHLVEISEVVMVWDRFSEIGAPPDPFSEKPE